LQGIRVDTSDAQINRYDIVLSHHGVELVPADLIRTTLMSREAGITAIRPIYSFNSTVSSVGASMRKVWIRNTRHANDVCRS
jgi:hypothetical protein